MAGSRRSDDFDAAVSLVRIDGFDRLGVEVRDQGAECRVAFGHGRVNSSSVSHVSAERGRPCLRDLISALRA